jgi:hypothetical protein
MTRTGRRVALGTLVVVVVALGFGVGRGVRRAVVEAPKAERATRVTVPVLPEGARPDEAAPPAAGVPPTHVAEASDAPTMTGPGALPPPKYFPRPASEWQGMLVNTAMQATCEVSARCGLAMACHEGKCGACTADSDCAGGEVCAVDHCVRQEHAACRHRSDCAGNELCVLSGYSTDVRGNGDMTATCRADGGGSAPPEPEKVARPSSRPAAPAAVDPQAMMASVHDADAPAASE